MDFLWLFTPDRLKNLMQMVIRYDTCSTLYSQQPIICKIGDLIIDKYLYNRAKTAPVWTRDIPVYWDANSSSGHNNSIYMVSNTPTCILLH